MPTLSKAYIKEVWSHSGFQKYLKGTGVLFFARVFNLAVSFFIGIAVVRYLGPTNNGLLSYSVSFVTFFSFIGALGIDQILYRELVKEPEKTDALLGTAFILRIVGNVVAVSLIAIATFFTETDNFIRGLIIINSLGLLFSSFNVMTSYFQSRVMANYQAIAATIVPLALSLLKLVVILTNKGVIYFSIVLVMENIFYMIIFFILYAKAGRNPFHWRYRTSVALELLRDSWPLLLSSVFTIIYTRIDQIMLKYMLGIDSVGIYDSAVRLSEVWYFIPALVISTVFPAIINARKTSTTSYENRLTYLYSLMLIIGVGVALPISLLSGWIMTTLYGPAFASGSSTLALYVWAGVPVFFAMAVNNYLLAENYTRIIFVSTFTGMASNILLNFIFIPRFGLEGAALATLCSYSLIPFSVFIFSKKMRGHSRLVFRAMALPFGLIFNK